MSATTIEPRLTNIAVLVPDALKGLLAVNKAAQRLGLSHTIAELVHLRASQINGCSVCVEMHSRGLREAGESDERIFSVAAWREAPYYSPAERAALALTEAGTRLADRGEAVSDEIWDEAAAHFDESQLAALVLEIAQINTWNRLNAITRQPSGQSW